MTPHMAPRRRNPKGGRHFAGVRYITMNLTMDDVESGDACKVPDTTPASIFQQPAGSVS